MAKKEAISTQAIIETMSSYHQEADEAKRSRIEHNRDNYDFYHLKQDFSHKLKGQSKEFLPRQAMAVEQIAQFMHQGLVDLGAFFSTDPMPGVREPIFTSDEARGILMYQLKQAGFYTYMQDAIKSGLLGSLIITKVHGELCPKARFYSRTTGDSEKLYQVKDKYWKLKLDLVRQEDFFPDPTAEGLYKQQRIYMDFWKLEQLVKENPDLYDLEEFKKLEGSLGGAENFEESHRARQTNQNVASAGYRRRIELWETWGNILDSSTGKLIYERVVCLVANQRYLIQKPMRYPKWANEDPFVVSPLIRSPHSMWHKALMDAPTKLNLALNELFNLIVDGGMQATFGIKQIRENWLDDPTQIADGIFPGITLSVNQACPPGMKVMERVDTGNTSSEGINAFNLASGEFNQSALTNDLRLGTLPPRSVKATEVMESSNSITSVFTGIGKAIEDNHVEPMLQKSWNACMENFSLMDPDDLKSILGERRFAEVKKISDKRRFSRTVNGRVFKVFGITQTLNKIKDFRKLTALMQTIVSAPPLAEAFTQKYDFTKLLGKIVSSLDINSDEIMHDLADIEMNQMLKGIPSEAGVESPDVQSQISQLSATGAGQMTEEGLDNEFEA